MRFAPPSLSGGLYTAVYGSSSGSGFCHSGRFGRNVVHLALHFPQEADVMVVRARLHYALEVSERTVGEKFYRSFGLNAERES